MKKLISLAIFVLVLSSCATIISGKTQSVNLTPTDNSERSEVEISNSKIVQNVTIPSMVIVPRANANLIIKVKESECYKASNSIHESKINWVIFVNFLGGWLSTSSTSTDSSTGALWSYDNRIMVNTQKKSSCHK